jgi:hypothetical protein
MWRISAFAITTPSFALKYFLDELVGLSSPIDTTPVRSYAPGGKPAFDVFLGFDEKEPARGSPRARG